MNPYERPEVQEVGAGTKRKGLPIGLVWFLGVCGAGPSLLFWPLGLVGPWMTGLACLVGGWCMARRLHKTPGVVALMSIIYGILIVVSLLGIVWGFCLVMLGTNNGRL